MTIQEKIAHLNTLIRQSEHACGRNGGEVQILAVSKGHSTAAMKEAYLAGLTEFGESYLQEAQQKITALHALPLTWHFIGPIQSNKTKRIAELFSWVHSVYRLNIAQRLNEARPENMPPLNVCVQVNMDAEETKSGVSIASVRELLLSFSHLPRLRLRGLMAIPKPLKDEEQQYRSFLRLTELFHTLNKELNGSMDTLSMGMSHDWPAAIRAGTTMIRIGTAIFGERTSS